MRCNGCGKVAIFKFQSAPGQKAGCNFSCTSLSAVGLAFQSSPGQKAGCNPRVKEIEQC